MTSKSYATVLLKAWEEKWSPKRWVREVQQSSRKEGDVFVTREYESLSDIVTKYALTGTEPNQFFLSCLQEGLKSQVLPSVSILDSITKISTWDRPKIFMTVISIIKDTLNFPSATEHRHETLHLPRTLAKTVYWLLCHTAEALKSCYKGMKENEEPAKLQDYLETLQNSQELLSSILDKEKLRDLVLVGKLGVEGDADVVQLQMHLKELMSVQNEGFLAHQDSSFVQESYKELFKTATRYLNMTSLVMSHERKPGHIPCKVLQYFIQFQLANDLPWSSQIYSDFLDIILRSENIPLDQFYVDLMRCSCHGILNTCSSEELFRWLCFFLYKVPSIVDVVRRKYKQSGGDNAIFFSACKQFVQFNTLPDDVDVKCVCRVFNVFLNQCKSRELLDATKTEAILGMRKPAAAGIRDTFPQPDSFPVGVVLSMGRNLTDILKVLNSPLETHRDMICQQLTSFPKALDVGRIVAIADATDQYVQLIQAFVRLNEQTKHAMDSSEDQNIAEIRCEIFNTTFVILFYITTIYGTRVLDEIEDKTAFFVCWRKNCTSGIGERNFSQASMDTLLDQVSMPGNVLPAQMAKWDEHCGCAGEVIRELAQAVGCRVINMDVFQRICEGFMIKRPALCIAASAWLLTQYKSLNVSDKDKTARILKHFKRPPTQLQNKIPKHFERPQAQQQNKSELVSKALERHAMPYGLEPSSPLQEHSDTINFTPVLIDTFKQSLGSWASKDHGLLFDVVTVNSLRRTHTLLGTNSFAENLVKVILNCGYVEKSTVYGNMAAIITLLDAEVLVPSFFQYVMLDIVRHKKGARLLADPRGRIVAHFLGIALAFYQVLQNTARNERGSQPRPPKLPRLDIPTTSIFQNHNDTEGHAQPFVDFLSALISELSSGETCAIHTFLASLLESVAVATTHLPRFLRLPDDMIQKLFELLPSQLSREVILLICDVTTPKGRQHAAKPLIANFLENP